MHRASENPVNNNVVSEQPKKRITESFFDCSQGGEGRPGSQGLAGTPGSPVSYTQFLCREQ